MTIRQQDQIICTSRKAPQTRLSDMRLEKITSVPAFLVRKVVVQRSPVVEMLCLMQDELEHAFAIRLHINLFKWIGLQVSPVALLWNEKLNLANLRRSIYLTDVAESIEQISCRLG